MNKSCRRHQSGPCAGAKPAVSAAALPPRREPEMRRWPHPVTCDPACREPELTALLRRQTELLLEIRAMLGRLTGEQDRRE